MGIIMLTYTATVGARENDDYFDEDNEGDLIDQFLMEQYNVYCMCLQTHVLQIPALLKNQSQTLMKLVGLLVMFAYAGITNTAVV